MSLFLLGLFLCGLAFIAAYCTQYRLLGELQGQAKDTLFQGHQTWLKFAAIAAFLGLMSFAAGSFMAVMRFS